MTDTEKFRNLKYRYVAFLKKCEQMDIPRDLTHLYNETRADILKTFDLEDPSDAKKLGDFFEKNNNCNRKEAESIVDFMKTHYGPLFVMGGNVPKSKEEYNKNASDLLKRLEDSVNYNEKNLTKFYEDAVGRIRGSRNLSPGDDSKKDAANRNVLSIAVKNPKTDWGLIR